MRPSAVGRKKKKGKKKKPNKQAQNREEVTNKAKAQGDHRGGFQSSKGRSSFGEETGHLLF